MKILHITTNNKFISHALSTFERVYPDKNTVWMLDTSGELNLADNKYDKSFSFYKTLSPFFSKKLKDFDLVILHNLADYWYPLIILSPAETKLAWLGWGFDYYEYIYKNTDKLLLGQTLEIKNNYQKNKSIKLKIKNLAKLPLNILVNKIIKPMVLKRINSFSPVLKEDYDLIARAKFIPFLPDFLPWNYGSLEENLITKLIGQRASGNSILVGNSATFTNNHIEVFELLSRFDFLDDIKIITPLSYGNEYYKNKVIEAGYKFLNPYFQPVTNFMPIDEYLSLIKQCSNVVMNHKRQQAVGNIVIMLYLGARVFLREENPTYVMLKKEGAILSTVQELELQPDLLKKPLLEKEIQKNIDVVYKHWSKNAIDNKTKQLVEFHLGDLQ